MFKIRLVYIADEATVSSTRGGIRFKSIFRRILARVQIALHFKSRAVVVFVSAA